MTSKPKGLAKIWREIKRPFQHVRQIWRNLRDDGDEMRKPYERVIQECVDRAMQRHSMWITDTIQANISTAILHQRTFSKFKNVHQGQEIVLVATGPTVNDYKRIDGAIHIGVNRAFQIENIDLHYLLIQDYKNTKPYVKEANLYKPDSCTKFYGGGRFTESDVLEAKALRYRTNSASAPVAGEKYTARLLSASRFCLLIDSEPFHNFKSVVFQAMQFALWTNPRTIYLVGCDCSSEGYWNRQFVNSSDGRNECLRESWSRLKAFAQRYYPDTKILSISPVGLKGLFDEYGQT